MSDDKTDHLPGAAEHGDTATAEALMLIETLVRTKSPEEIQELATTGRLEELFPDLCFDQATPDLGAFENLTPAAGPSSSVSELEHFLKTTR